MRSSEYIQSQLLDFTKVPIIYQEGNTLLEDVHEKYTAFKSLQ